MNKAQASSQASPMSMLLPLALAQFIASFAATNMNVAITDIAKDIGTTVSGIQTAITLFTLTMAALMIPGSKLTDIWGRKKCFVLGLIIYASGAILSALAHSLGLIIFGYSLLEGIGSALMIPPIYIFVTVLFSELSARAKSFGIVSAAAGVGSAAGPLIGGLITSAISWRASFITQALVVICILFLSRRIYDPGVQGKKPQFDSFGAILSALGLLSVVIGILQIKEYGLFIAKKSFSLANTTLIPEGSISPVLVFMGIGALLLFWFFIHIRRREKSGKEPLLSTKLFHNRVSNLGLITQNVQWLIMQGGVFVISVFLQTSRGLSAIQTGVILFPATLGILLSSAFAGRMAKRRPQRTLICWGFIATIGGFFLLLLSAKIGISLFIFLLGLFIVGCGIGVMLTASVNVVQSSFPEKDQGEISGLSRSISNLGSSLGTAIAGTVLIVTIASANKSFAYALITMILIGCIGLFAAILLPKSSLQTPSYNV